jgi:diketogulonate reductase-like aldo/keto reductase
LDFYRELIKLYESGKVRAIGMANCNVERLEEIKKTFGVLPMVNQIELHPFCQQKEIVDYCKENNIIVEAYSPFAHGAIMQDLLNNETLHHIANNHGKTITQTILRWIVQQEIVALPRSSNPKHIKENASVFDFKLTDEEMSQIHEMDLRRGYSKFAHNNPNQYSSIGD